MWPEIRIQEMFINEGEIRMKSVIRKMGGFNSAEVHDMMPLTKMYRCFKNSN